VIAVADETPPLAQAYAAYEQLEGRLSTALDKVVATNAFADLLATSATNVMAVTRLANGTVDRAVRTTRLAARTDVTDLARQLARTEEKLERLLQLVEALGDRLDQQEAASSATGSAAPAGPVGSANGTARPRAASGRGARATKAQP
jgi:hypothetical protein